MSALSVALCFTVIIVGGAMALLSDVSVQQGLGVFLIVSTGFKYSYSQLIDNDRSLSSSSPLFSRRFSDLGAKTINGLF